MGIVKATKHPAEAELFLKFLMTADSQKAFVAGLRSSTRQGVDWPPAVKDAQTASENVTTILDDADQGTYLHAEFVNNVLYADVEPVFLGTAKVADFAAKISADAKTYWSNH
jgi:ABC-type glycerol-3-phosphate transport system substrate-binding protein